MLIDSELIMTWVALGATYAGHEIAGTLGA